MRKLYSIVLGLLFCAGIVHAQVVEDGLVSYWTFNEDTVEGNTVRDTRGQSHGEFEGNPQIVPGKFDEGLELDGNSRVRIVEFAEWDWVDSFTVDVWINPSLIAGDERTIFLLDKPGNLWPIRLQLNRDNTMVFNARVQGVSGTKFMASITSDVPLDTWSHVALRFSGADSKVDAFFNGVLEGSTNTDKELLADIDDVIIGCYTNMGTDHFVGILDEMRVYNKALTDAEIEQNYNATGLAVAKDSKLSVTWGSVKI